MAASRSVFEDDYGREYVANGEVREPKDGEFFIDQHGQVRREGVDANAHGFRAIVVRNTPEFKAPDSVGVAEADTEFILVCGHCLEVVERIELKATRQVTHYMSSRYGFDAADYPDMDEGGDREEIQVSFDDSVRYEFDNVDDWGEDDNYEDPYEGSKRCECPHCEYESDHDDNYFWVTTEAARLRAKAMKQSGIPQHEVIDALTKT